MEPRYGAWIDNCWYLVSPARNASPWACGSRLTGGDMCGSFHRPDVSCPDAADLEGLRVGDVVAGALEQLTRPRLTAMTLKDQYQALEERDRRLAILACPKAEPLWYRGASRVDARPRGTLGSPGAWWGAASGVVRPRARRAC
ncbi:hypothetical protein GCM10020295_01210 [Streptomyces cinereospinus]